MVQFYAIIHWIFATNKVVIVPGKWLNDSEIGGIVYICKERHPNKHI